jgi:ligand-binding sensor domain-containing protein/AraC-like DNA-binding protein/anti-sigma regulatory factor (Ser/Thr protein kinase)
MNKTSICIFPITIVLFFVFQLEKVISAEKRTFKHPQSKLRHYTTEDGLSHDGVLCITQDKEGFIWFGTWDGINRFDGSNFVTYKARPGDNSSLKNNKIRDIIEDKLGYLWVKTYDRKVYRFDKSSEKFLALNNSNNKGDLESYPIDKIIPLSNGDVWLISENGSLILIHNDKNEKLLKAENFTKNNLFLRDRKVSFVFEDQYKRLWIGTDKGLSCLVESNGNYQSYFKGRIDVFAEKLNFLEAAKNQNGMAFTTSKGHLITYDNVIKQFVIRNITNNIPINNIYVSKDQNIYLSTIGKGLFIFNNDLKTIENPKFNGFSSFSTISEDTYGNIWLEPELEGVVKYSPETNSFKYFNHKKEQNTTTPIKGKFIQDKNYKVFNDVNGYTWISMKGGGFGFYNPIEDKIEYFKNEPGSTTQQFSNVVVSAFSDNKGVLWLSTRNGGINKAVFSGNNFNHHVLVQNSTNRLENEVRAIHEDSDGKIWITTKIGDLYVYQSNRLIANVIDSEEKLGTIYTIKETRNGIIWIGTKGQGLIKATPINDERTKYKIKRFVNDPQDLESLSNDHIYSILEDNKGQIWVGTFGGGLNKIVQIGEKVRFKNINTTLHQYPASTFNVIRYLANGPDGNIWIGTTDGLLRFDPTQNLDQVKFKKSVKIQGSISSIGNNDVQYIYVTKNEDVYIGTFGGGLNKVSKPKSIDENLKFEVFTQEAGLSNDIVLSITEDDNNHLWIATENGLSRFNLETYEFRNYDSYDGLPRSGFSEASCFKSKTGELYFGCTRGYLYFNPKKIEQKKYHSNLVFTNFQLFNNRINPDDHHSVSRKSINELEEVVLKHDENFITIDFAVLDFRAVNNLNYSYILEGFDKNWHQIKSQKKATYTKLPPGKYIFKVKVTNPDYFLKTPHKSINIIVKPPFWKTWWAYLFYSCIGVFAFMLIRRNTLILIKLRNKVLVEEKLTEMKLQFFTNISHELRTPLTLIVNPLDKIYQTENLSEKGQHYLNIVNKNTNRMVRFINQLLDFRKIQNNQLKLKVCEFNIVDFIKDLSLYFDDILDQKNIKLNFLSESNMVNVFADKEKIDIVFYNILSNAIKFTPKNLSISVDIEENDKNVLIKFIDEGIGINKSELEEIFELYHEGDHQQDKAFKGTGIGLALSKEIVLAHKGKIYAKNNEERGMTFTVELLKGKEHFKLDDLIVEDFMGLTAKQTVIDKKGNLNVDFNQKNEKSNLPKLLIVEDNSDLRELIKDQFNDIYEIIEAENGEEGLSLAIENLPDVIISDVMMPVLDGIQMLDQIKTNMKTSHIPVILLTARSSIENQISGLSYGADFYVTKPFHADYVHHLIDNLLNQRKKIVENILENNKTLILAPSEIVITSKDEIFLKEVINIIEKGMFDSQFNIDSVATAIGMGRTTFYKKLKSLTSLSPVEFVREIRLKRSKQLLSSKQYSVSEVAYMTGFTSSGYFSTCFKEKYGCSPSDFIKNFAIKQTIKQ